MSLTHDAIRRMANSDGHGDDPSFNPVIQVIQVRRVGGANANQNSERYRVILSDGDHFVQGMLATQLNHFVHSDELKDFALVRIKDYMKNNIQKRIVLILLGIEILSNPGAKMGSPQDFERAGGASSSSSSSSSMRPTPQAQPMYGSRAPATVSPENSYSGGGGSRPDMARSVNNHRAGGSNPYGGNSMARTSAPIVRSNAPSQSQHYVPISGLNMYQSRWTIRARITSKSEIRHWSNAKGEGQLFSIELLDSSGTDIRATFFREAVDKFYNMLNLDQVYTFSGGRLKVANMQWNTCKSGFEITFDQNAEIHQETGDTGDIKQQNYDFIAISDIEGVEPGKNVDVLAIVKNVGDVANIISKKKGQELTKCDLTLLDTSGAEITMTVWGERATNAAKEFADTPVVAFRRARVSDYGGRTLSTSMSGAIIVGPRIPEADQLQSWWTSVGATGAAPTKSLSTGYGGGAGRQVPFAERKCVAAIKDENMGYKESPDWIHFKATISFIKKDRDGGAWYPACPNAGEPCKNRYKVSQITDGSWYCEKCQGTYPNCVRRYIFSATLADETATTWVSIFNEQAEGMFGGLTADEMYAKTYGEENNMDAYNSYFARASYTEWIFACKIKNELVGDESRVKATVISMNKVDYVQETKHMLEALEKM